MTTVYRELFMGNIYRPRIYKGLSLAIQGEHTEEQLFPHDGLSLDIRYV
jgi:hypothetical protein